ncbi:MAG TPA: GAF domain-containing protein [Blastocatellia bacterium]|nr:GAF domain-containing protein [Blastocatellia bacterium]
MSSELSKQSPGGPQPTQKDQRSAGIESLLSEVSRHYEEQLAAVNKELSSVRAALARAQFPPLKLQASEIDRLQEAFNSADRERIALRTQLDQADEKIDSLANLYLAAFSLHKSHDWNSVIRAMNDILVNQVGAESYAVLLSKPDHGFETIAASQPEPNLPDTENIDLLMKDNQVKYDLSGLVASVPLFNGNETIGVILIERLLAQKKTLSDENKKLISALSNLAATAIDASRSSRMEEQPAQAAEQAIAEAAPEDMYPSFEGIPEINEEPPVPFEAAELNLKKDEKEEDQLHDLSELPASLMDYSTLLEGLTEPFETTNEIRETQPDYATATTLSACELLEPRKEEVNDEAESYLKLLEQKSSNPAPTEASPSPNEPPTRQVGSVHREIGLLFRQAPIKRN